MAKEVFTAPWYPWYVRDVLVSESVKMLSLAEEGAYRRALDNEWMEGSVPSDPAQFARVIGKGCTVKIAARVLETCFTPMSKDASRSVNKKMEKIRTEQKQKVQKKSEAGKRGMANRWKQRGNSDNTVITEGITKHNYSDTDTDTDKEEEKRVETHKAASLKKGSRLPDQFFLTAEMKAWAAERNPNVDINLETEKFCNYWRAKTGRDATKLDWTATWRNWILNAGGHANGRTNYRQQRADEAIADRNTIEGIRARVAARRRVSGGDAADRERQLHGGVTDSDSG